MYDTAEYANQRLEGTIVTYNNVPVRVLDCRGLNKIKAVVEFLYDTTHKREVLLKELDITPVKLGFVNNYYGVSYLCRIPMRRDWKQGLRPNTLRSSWGIDPRWVTDRELHNCIVGNYPKFEAALEEVVNTNVPKAFHRLFALTSNLEGNVFLLYKHLGPVGDVVNKQPKLYDKYNFLIETLDAVMAEQ